MFNRLVILIICGLLLSSCGTSHNPSAIPERPNLAQVINNSGSMTYTLKSLDKNLSVTLLKTGTEGDQYERVVALKLSGTPVIVAISQTNIHNTVFKELIAHSDVTPLGVKLFAPNSPYKRLDNMKINHINLLMIDNKQVSNYLRTLGYSKNSDIIERVSQFAYQNERLDLVEYVLPTINNFVNI